MDYDVPRFAGKAAELAEAAGQLERARGCWSLSAREWRRLGRDADADSASARADALR